MINFFDRHWDVQNEQIEVGDKIFHSFSDYLAYNIHDELLREIWEKTKDAYGHVDVLHDINHHLHFDFFLIKMKKEYYDAFKAQDPSDPDWRLSLKSYYEE